jgi:hypothetical protein
MKNDAIEAPALRRCAFTAYSRRRAVLLRQT